MSEMFSNRYRVVVASESTYGTDAVNTILTTATADIIYQDVRACSILNTRVLFNPTRQRAQNSGVRHITFSDMSAVEMEVPLTGKVGAGAGDEAPYYDPIWSMLGFKSTVVSTTSCTYTPSTVQQSAASIYKWTRNAEDANWRLQYTTGVRGTATLSLAVNEEAYLSVSANGLYQELMTDAAAFFNSSDEAALLKDGSTAVTARTTGTEVQVDKTALGCKQMTITYNGTTLPISNMEINFNRTQDMVRTVNGTETVSKVILTVADATRIEGSFSLQDGDAAFDLVRDALAGDTEYALSVALTDGTDTITISMPKVQIGVYSEAANGQLRTFDVPFFLNGDWSSLTADNGISIAYT